MGLADTVNYKALVQLAVMLSLAAIFMPDKNS